MPWQARSGTRVAARTRWHARGGTQRDTHMAAHTRRPRTRRHARAHATETLVTARTLAAARTHAAWRHARTRRARGGTHAHDGTETRWHARGGTRGGTRAAARSSGTRHAHGITRGRTRWSRCFWRRSRHTPENTQSKMLRSRHAKFGTSLAPPLHS